jgi:hypothetical protein
MSVLCKSDWDLPRICCRVEQGRRLNEVCYYTATGPESMRTFRSAIQLPTTLTRTTLPSFQERRRRQETEEQINARQCPALAAKKPYSIVSRTRTRTSLFLFRPSEIVHTGNRKDMKPSRPRLLTASLVLTKAKGLPSSIHLSSSHLKQSSAQHPAHPASYSPQTPASSVPRARRKPQQ